MIANNIVEMNSKGIYIEGKSEIIMCGSLFYFRIPREMWRDRLRKIKTAGYNCIDVYFPWNFHETCEGVWDFSSDKDIKEFLKMVKDEGLWVIARPGPYICSEWDGGSLPSYLLVKQGIKIRDNNEVYLNYVREWYKRVLPIIAENQLGGLGSVILVQLENELDFYNCSDVEGYMSALRDMAKEYGITVPLVACAGQFDVLSAGGTTKGIYPTLNVYPNLKDTEFEYKLKHYYEEFKKINIPLCITETDRRHWLLKRELMCGTKFIGPYNQVGGTDFGYTTAINNWGEPLSYMVHDYNFGGMITPQGELTEEFFEARLMNGLVNSLGQELAEAQPIFKHEFKVSSDVKIAAIGASVLKLKSSGFLLGITNLDDRIGNINISCKGIKIPKFTTLKVNEMRCLLLMVEVPLANWGFQGTINYSTAELLMVKTNSNSTFLIFHSEHQGEISLNLEHAEVIVVNMEVHTEDGETILCFNKHKLGKAYINFEDGRKLVILTCSREDACAITEVDCNGDILADKNKFIGYKDVNLTSAQVKWSFNEIQDSGEDIGENKIYLGSEPDYMEQSELYRGYGFYSANVNFTSPCKVLGYVIHNPADVISMYVDNKYLGTNICAGVCKVIPEDSFYEKSKLNISIRAEIWGHSNFSDSRLPAMRAESLKGISGVTVITNFRNINDDWKCFKGEESSYCITKEKNGDEFRPVSGFGSYNNPEPQVMYYKKSIEVSKGTSSWVLYIENLNSMAELYLDGAFVKTLNYFDPYVVLDKYLKPGKIHDMTVCYRQRYLAESRNLKVILIEGARPENWSLSGAEEKELWKNAENNTKTNKTSNFPITLESGKLAWLSGEFIPCDNKFYSYEISCKGKNLKLTLFINGKMLGRLWLENEETMPYLSGGKTDLLYLPFCYLKDENKLEVLVEAVNSKQKAELEEVNFKTINYEWV